MSVFPADPCCAALCHLTGPASSSPEAFPDPWAQEQCLRPRALLRGKRLFSCWSSAWPWGCSSCLSPTVFSTGPFHHYCVEHHWSSCCSALLPIPGLVFARCWAWDAELNHSSCSLSHCLSFLSWSAVATSEGHKITWCSFLFSPPPPR